jgi:hypothetical protein
MLDHDGYSSPGKTSRARFASRVGLIAACIATAFLIIELLSLTQVPIVNPSWQGFLFICGWVLVLAALTTFVAGLLASGTQRFVLIGTGMMFFIVQVLAAVANFGN